MKFDQTLMEAKRIKKDVVLRNVRTEPPVVKIMNYKLELLKRLMKKLGKELN